MKDTDTKLEELRACRDHAYAKAAEWTARGKEYDRKILEVENTEILRVVRGLVVSPEDLRGLLNNLRAAAPQEQEAMHPERKEEIKNNVPKETG